MKYREITERGVRFRVFENDQVWYRTDCAEWKRLSAVKRRGRPEFWITYNGRCMGFDQFRLKALAYVSNPEHKTMAHAKDGNRLNLSTDNIEWITRQEHMNRMRFIRLDNLKRRKEECGSAEIEKDPNRKDE